MEIDIIQRDVHAADLQDHVIRRIHAALDRFDAHVLRVTVRLRDENGPKGGGDDIACRIEIKLRGHELFIEERGATPEAAIAAAADAAQEAVRREAGRRKRGVGGQRNREAGA
ncbi:MAG: HPF/RaiA family ribosome-associated protein [Planctomycetota bacterium]